ncbi:Mortality factor 4-like protein 1 [Triticum urartu]|uniref:Mortality factor 4-like protein 1 n=1 Tax=Triticum urartu TaxID=4572 RepID=M8AMS8_TRIUA|nr:Mortality factor 4-like protein 1 [Triticum urartu]
MGGSSNTTTTTSGGAGGKDKDRDRAKGSSVSFTEGEKVLAYHGPLLYEAKVQKTENREDEWRYFVHYLGWNKNRAFHFLKFEDCGNEGILDRLYTFFSTYSVFNGYSWDEWVASDRLLKLTEENVRKQLELKNQSGDKTVRTGGRSAQHNPKGSNADAKGDKEDTKGLVKGKKRKNQLGVEVAMIPKHEKERRSSESLLMSQFPVTLKKQLVDDWEFVTQLGKLVKLPRSPTVDDILTKYLEYRVKKDNKISDSCAEVTKGLRCYFDKALPAMLLYKKEQKQYKEEIKGDVSPSTVYGAEHLLRLFVKLPELLSSVNMEEDALNKLQQKLLDILKFLQKNQVHFFLSAYDGDSKGADGAKGK